MHTPLGAVIAWKHASDGHMPYLRLLGELPNSLWKLPRNGDELDARLQMSS